MEATLVSLTQPVVGTPASNAESLIAYCARVSSSRPEEEWGKDYEGLLRYCMRNKHWSVFEMADATVKIKAPRDITRQLLRHRSFSFQEFSQRYSDSIDFCEREIRFQDKTNRQNSMEYPEEESFIDFSALKGVWDTAIEDAIDSAKVTTERFRQDHVAKECTRVFLPEGLTTSTLFMKGSLRSWIHYLEVRDDPGVTQKEHVELARLIRQAVAPAFPTILKDIS